MRNWNIPAESEERLNTVLHYKGEHNQGMGRRGRREERELRCVMSPHQLPMMNAIMM